MVKEMALRRIGVFSATFLFCLSSLSIPAFSGEQKLVKKSETKPSLLIGDFVIAIDAFAHEKQLTNKNEATQLWLDAFEKAGVSKDFLKKRLEKFGQQNNFADPFAKFKMIEIEKVESVVENDGKPFVRKDIKAALHAFKITAEDEYDDFLNDDVYMYFITTYDDLMWGKVTSVYKDLDQGDSVFLSPTDRGIFGPSGAKVKLPENHVIVDFGLIESDGDDVKHLKKISGIIVDLALVALTIYNPEAGVAAAQARAETKNLIKALIGLNDDDRLLSDSIYFTPQSVQENLEESSIHEFTKRYSHETFWTKFDYKIGFRMIR